MCVELARITGGRMWHWRTAYPIGRSVGLAEAEADAAIVHAIEAGWMIGEGQPPHRCRQSCHQHGFASQSLILGGLPPDFVRETRRLVVWYPARVKI
jgi:hypothetical protein